MQIEFIKIFFFFCNYRCILKTTILECYSTQILYKGEFFFSNVFDNAPFLISFPFDCMNNLSVIAEHHRTLLDYVNHVFLLVFPTKARTIRWPNQIFFVPPSTVESEWNTNSTGRWTLLRPVTRGAGTCSHNSNFVICVSRCWYQTQI